METRGQPIASRTTVQRPRPPAGAGADPGAKAAGTAETGETLAPVHLVAVQAEMRAVDYRDAAAFGARIAMLAEHALAELPAGPTLLVFPEAIGLPLPLTLSDPGLATELAAELPVGSSLGSVAVRWLLRNAAALLRAAPRAGFGAVWHPGAVAADALLREVFAAVARRHGVTVVAGSALLPLVDQEPSRGAYVRRARVRNVSLLFGPDGSLLGRSAKVVPTPLERWVGVAAAPLQGLRVVDTPVGRVGTAICLDGFHRNVVEHLDAQGCTLLLQPSANHADWERRWPADPDLTEGEAWLERGLRSGVRTCRTIRYAVNPMLVGDVGPLHPRGRSSIVANPRFDPAADADGCEGWPGVVALAPDPDRGTALRVTVHLPIPVRSPR